MYTSSQKQVTKLFYFEEHLQEQLHLGTSKREVHCLYEENRC